MNPLEYFHFFKQLWATKDPLREWVRATQMSLCCCQGRKFWTALREPTYLPKWRCGNIPQKEFPHGDFHVNKATTHHCCRGLRFREEALWDLCLLLPGVRVPAGLLLFWRTQTTSPPDDHILFVTDWSSQLLWNQPSLFCWQPFALYFDSLH